MFTLTFDWIELQPCGLSFTKLIIRSVQLEWICVVSLCVYVWWDWYQILPIHLLHTNWTIVAPLFYSLRFSVSLPAYINLQRSCRKASCSSSRESHIIFKAVMMNIQTICLPSGSYCSLFVITQMGVYLQWQ